MWSGGLEERECCGKCVCVCVHECVCGWEGREERCVCMFGWERREERGAERTKPPYNTIFLSLLAVWVWAAPPLV